MKTPIALTLVLVVVQAHAAWSAFAHVTPETEKKYQLAVDITPIQNEKDGFRIKFPAVGYDHKQAWLIVTSDKLTEKEQELRNYIWESIKPPKRILVKAKLSPRETAALSSRRDEPRHYEVELSAEMIERAYIYIDFPSMVLDGGYYYSIDLPAYLARYKEALTNSSRRTR